MIKIEINYSLRAHILPAEDRILTTEAFGEPVRVRTVAPMEIFAAKMNALLNRAAARDLYDVCNMVENGSFADRADLFRKCIVFYSTISARKASAVFDTSAIDCIAFQRIKTELFPVLATKGRFDLNEKKQIVKDYLKELMQLTTLEQEYIDRFIAEEYRPDLLFNDKEIVERIQNHPMAIWKCR